MNFQEELKRELTALLTKEERDKARKAEELLAREQAWKKRKKELEPEARYFIENVLFPCMKEIVDYNRKAHYARVTFVLKADEQVYVLYRSCSKKKSDHRRYVEEKVNINWDVVRTAKELAENDYNIICDEKGWKIEFAVKFRD